MEISIFYAWIRERASQRRFGNYVKRNRSGAGAIHGLGAADHVELGLFRTDVKQFVGHTYDGMYEIASLNGNISQMEGKVYLHLHGGDRR